VTSAVLPYWALTRASMRSTLRYRISFFMGMAGMLFQLLALLAVWRVLIADATLGGFTWPQMRAYLLVAFTCGLLVNSLADWRMAYRIESGMVALDLVKPIDYQLARLAEIVGGVLIELAMAAVVWTSVILVSGGLPVPPPGRLALFVLSLALVLPLKFLVAYTCGLACFWTHHYTGVRWAQLAVVGLLSGTMIPIAFFPGWLATTAAWLPFAGMASTPGLIYVGRVDGLEALRLVALQACWAVLLWLLARWAFRSALRRLTVHGG
jgi:ABC-2 type transport system permease protein